ncbi:melanocyte protein PMEL-like [Pelobates fuscus]|uniref:melanocyte protein PMEL-like n=1 Tax=Pelobates fuscus TaxID=191477 RepID=UPI002FE45A0A
MQGIWALAVLCVLFAEIEAQNGSRNRVQQSKQPVQSNKRGPFKSWNSQMYPIWNGGKDQKRDCWKGGEVTFDIVNDSPTLTGAKTTFSIKLNFPKNQTVLPDGQVIWNQNCTENGTWVSSGEPVYPDETTEGADCSFPDGRPFPLGAEKRRSKFVYVWQTWGKYWQVVDGPVSNLTVDTDDVPLGSYNMEVVVYHYRGRQKFIPIGSTSSQYAITDQIPVSVSISQLQDLNEADQRFIQNRAVSFSVAVHDPSHYLQAADISFSWDFGDQSGTLITRNTDVTHTYISSGVFRPKLTMQAAIPISPCGSTAASITEGTDTTNVPPEPTTEAEASTTGVPVLPTETESPSNTTLPVEAELITAESELNMEVVTVPEVVPAEGEAATDPEVVPAEGEAATDAEVVPAEGEAATDAEVVPAEGEAATDAEVVPAEGEAAVDPEVVPAEGEAATDAEVVPAEGEAAAVPEVVPAEGEAAAVPEVVPAEGEAAAVPEVVPAEGEAAAVPEVVPAEGEAAAVPEVVPAEGEAAAVPEVVPAEGEAAAVPEVVPAEGEAAAVPEVVPAEGEAAAVPEVVPAEGEAAAVPEVVPAEGEAAAVPEVVPAEGEAAAVPEVVPAEGEAAAVPEVVPAEGEAAAVPEVVPAEGEAAAVPEVVPAEGEAAAVPEVVPAEGEAAAVPEVVPAEGEAAAVPEVVPVEGEAAAVPEVVPVEGEAAAVPEVVPVEGEAAAVALEVEVASAAQTVAATGQEDVLLLAKRQAPEDPLVGCLLYRYGTFATELDVVQGIESVEIVQVDSIAAVGVENAVDLTITCQGGLPSQVCTVISDSNCQIPQETLCNPVEPSSDCQMVLRQVFNGTGTFCVNVSLTDNVSLAVASTQVTVSGGPVSSTNGIVVTVGILLVALAVAAVAYTYRRTKSYTPLRTENASINWFPDRSSLRLFFQNALGRSINGESSPLLNGHVV